VKRPPTHATIEGARYLALRALAQDGGRPTAELLQLYVLEGFLDRLARSSSRDRLVLKGGVLLAAFEARRPTRDIDLLALRTPNDMETIRELVAGIAAEPVEDGLEFDLTGVRAEVMREGDSYSGVRVTLSAALATARLVFHVDVNVGDPVWPGPQVVEVPRLLQAEPIRVSGYPLCMVLAEKIVTAVQRGAANTRWRDFADVLLLTSKHPVEGADLQRAISEVAGYREAGLRPLREVLDGFAPLAQPRWRTWLRRQDLGDRLPAAFEQVLDGATEFADPALDAQVEGLRWDPVAALWKPVARTDHGA
jgi:hypothetical protein